MPRLTRVIDFPCDTSITLEFAWKELIDRQLADNADEVLVLPSICPLHGKTCPIHKIEAEAKR